MSKPVKQIHLAAHFPGVNNTTVWSDPRSGSHIDFSSFAHLAQTAERAKFDCGPTPAWRGRPPELLAGESERAGPSSGGG